MSFHFYINSKQKLTFEKILKGIKFNKVGVLNGNFYSPENEVLGYSILYIPNKSTRGVILKWDEKGFDIGLYLLSSKEDYELAVEIVKSISILTNTNIRTSDSNEIFDLNNFLNIFDEKWITKNKLITLEIIKSVIERDDFTKINGIEREFYIGKNLLSILSEFSSNNIEVYENLINRMLEIQYIDELDYRIPNSFITDDEGEKKTYAVISSKSYFKQFLPKVDFLYVFVNDFDNFIVPYNRISQLNSNIKLIDEYQYIIEDFSEVELKQLSISI